MKRIIQYLKRFCKKTVITILAVIVATCLVSDSVYYTEVAVQEPITSAQIAKSCAPSKIFHLEEVNISTGSGWKIGHAYKCLGRSHVITTVNQVGILDVDKLVSHAIVLNYVWLLNEIGDINCKNEIKVIKPTVAGSNEALVLFAPYVLTCQDVE